MFMFAGPSASVGGGCSTKSTEDCGEDSCAVGAVQPEARRPVGEDGDVDFGVQAMPQRKSGKRLINARLPLKRQGAKQQEVSCLPAEEWGLQALDAVEVTVQSRILETEITRTLQAWGKIGGAHGKALNYGNRRPRSRGNKLQKQVVKAAVRAIIEVLVVVGSSHCRRGW